MPAVVLTGRCINNIDIVMYKNHEHIIRLGVSKVLELGTAHA
jgi:hypothetical protein